MWRIFRRSAEKCVKGGCLNVSAVTLGERMTGAALLALVLIMGGILLQNVRRGGRTRQAPLCSRARGSFLRVRADHGAVQKAGCVVGNNRITGVVHQLDAPHIAFEGKKQGVCDDFPSVYQ